MKKDITIMAAAITLTACTANQPKALVLYYSQEGTTKAVAEEIAAQTGADIMAFDVTVPYTGTFDETVSRCLKERSEGFVPELAPIGADISAYDVIYLGYPIWFGTYAPPVKALLNSISLDGKTVIPFCSFGSGGLQSSTADLKTALPEANILEGYGVRTARVYAIKEEINRFLILSGLKEGEIEAYAEFSGQHPVSEAEAEIFDAACSGYQFPLGTPISCSSRHINEGTEYLFTAESTTDQGGKSTSKIYIIADRKDGGKPEFTQVIR